MLPHRLCKSEIPFRDCLLQSKMSLQFDEAHPYLICSGFLLDKETDFRRLIGEVKLSVQSIRQAVESLDHHTVQSRLEQHAKLSQTEGEHE
mgnify:FL=1